MAIRSPTLAELEIAIGSPPNRGGDIALCERITREIGLRQSVNQWLIKQGIPSNSATTANPLSVARAYCAIAYLKAWRNRVNPGFGLLGDDDDDDASKASTETSVPPWGSGGEAAAPFQGEPQVQAAEDHKMSAEWLKSLFAQIETTTSKLVDAKLEGAKLTLAEGAKAQVRQMVEELARSTAIAVVERMMPPREILIKRTDATGASTETNVGLQHERFGKLLRAVQARDHRGFRLNVWLTGPTGSGKTTAAENVARALGLAFGSDGSLDSDYKVLGFKDANGNVVSTQFLEIYENGGIYVADEIDNWLPSALLSLNAALANGWVSCPKGMIKRHPDCCVIACANTWGLGATSDYVGRTRLDAATLDRFHPKLNWPVDEKLEFALAQRQAGALGTAWHSLILTARHAAVRQGLKIIISPRATFNGLALLKEGFEPTEVVEMTIGAGISPEQFKGLNLGSAIMRVDEAVSECPSLHAEAA